MQSSEDKYIMDWGIIGNCQSAALIDSCGSIVWGCLPEFDSASVFAKILDSEKGGEFSIQVDRSYKTTQSYIERTNILKTTFAAGDNVFEVIDFMPRYKKNNHIYHCPPEIIRYIRHVSGTPEACFVYQPKLAYAEHPTHNVSKGNYIKSTVNNGIYESIYLYTDISHKKILNNEPVKITDDHYFLVNYNQKILDLDIESIQLFYERTKLYWMEWVEKGTTYSHYKKEITRSALILKLLSVQKSGAILAAVTTSLPEAIGEERNWDYRFCWIRDASMILTVMTELGHYNIAERFFAFIMDVIPYKDSKMQIMYGIRGQEKLVERELSWLEGYKRSGPVRIGNAAYTQKQNDIYGVLLDVIYKYLKIFKSDVGIIEDIWTVCRSLIRTVENSWYEPDTGIWEYRNRKEHFVFSKVLCWVAMDRGVKIARLLDKNLIAREWSKTRNLIKKDVLKNGWNEKIAAFTQSYSNQEMDAANLLMASYGFIKPADHRFVSTVERIKKCLCKNNLMFRYRNSDDFGKPKSAFTACSFWLVKSLYQTGKKLEARKMFDQLLKMSNKLGIFSEDIGFETYELLGNFPQGYSHLALIDCAVTLGNMTLERDSELLETIGKIQTGAHNE